MLPLVPGTQKNGQIRIAGPPNSDECVHYFRHPGSISLVEYYANVTVEAGIDVETAFALGLITSALQTVFVMLSWILTTYLGRRTIYLWGSGFNAILLVVLGIAASVGKSDAASLAQAALGLIVSVLFTLGPAFVSLIPTIV